jgi:hypothetical protein
MQETWIAISFILLETLKFISIFLVCHYYCKQALSFLANKHQWMSMLKFLLLIGISISVIGGVILILQGLLEEKGENLCKRPIFLILRAGGEIIVFFFFAVGVMLTIKLKNLQRETHFEKTK